jgi:phosphomannomutase
MAQISSASRAHKFHPTVLREYDIRGQIGKTLSAEDAYAVGLSFGSYCRKNGASKVCIGYDGRLSSPELETNVIKGLMEVGVDVIRVGRGPTPMLYFSVYHLEADAGIMITGSHNPPDYNGFKMMIDKGPVYGDAILEIGKIAENGDFASGQGSVQDEDVKADYIKRLVRGFDWPNDIKIAWDAGNGAAGEVLRMLVDEIPGEHFLLYDEIDGNFPNHHPDPTIEENLQDLVKVVLEKGCDMGIGFDGDADRIGAVDNLGRVVWGDQLLALYAQKVLKDIPGATVIADVKASQTLFDEIKRLGGKPLMWKTGHSLLKAKMKETGAPLAGEMSGHIFFADDFYGFDDALYCGLRLIDLTIQASKSLSQMSDELPQVVNTPEVRFQVDESRKFDVVDEVKSRLKDVAGIQVNDLDGVRVNTDHGWWLLRASNTQDVLVARAESATEEGLEILKAQIIEQLKASGINAPFEQRQ